MIGSTVIEFVISEAAASEVNGPYRRKGVRENGTAEYRKVDSETGRDARDPEINIYCNEGGWRIIGRQNYYQTFGGVQGEVPPENGWQRYHCDAPFPKLSFCSQLQGHAAREVGGASGSRAGDASSEGEEADVDVAELVAEYDMSPADEAAELAMRLHESRAETLLCLRRPEEAARALLQAHEMFCQLSCPLPKQVEAYCMILVKLCAMHHSEHAAMKAAASSLISEEDIAAWQRTLEKYGIAREDAMRVGALAMPPMPPVPPGSPIFVCTAPTLLCRSHLCVVTSGLTIGVCVRRLSEPRQPGGDCLSLRQGAGRQQRCHPDGMGGSG